MAGKNKISQDYFDSVVLENINDFGMGEAEAIEDAINQLNSQQGDLSLICKHSIAERNELKAAIEKLRENLELNKVGEKTQEIIETFNSAKSKLEKDLSFRVYASNSLNAYSVFSQMLKNLDLTTTFDNKLIVTFLAALQAYITQQSDVLDEAGRLALIKLLNQEQDNTINIEPVLSALLRCLNTACVMNEPNRQFFVENGLCECLMHLFEKHKASNAVITDACQLIRALLLDDDLRVEFGKSHEHAKYIASELNGLDVLLHIGLGGDELSEDTLANLMLTLSRLAVRNEFCQEICDKGGLKFVLKCIVDQDTEKTQHLNNISLLKSALSLLKSICNNDQVKHEATKGNVIMLLKVVLQKYVANPQICELSCGALCSILLRNNEACEQLYQLQVHPILVQILTVHYQKPKVLKLCCLALRNSISRNKSLGEKLLELRIEESLRQIMSNSQNQSCHEEAKAVLRDLGCHIELKELWTGAGKTLSYD